MTNRTMPLTHSARRLNKLSSALGVKTYLEIGVEHGHTFFDVAAQKKFAVDPNFRFDPATKAAPGLSFAPTTSDAFFETYSGAPFDLAFLDGLHHFEQTLRDLLNTLIHATPKTVIVIDDVYPSDVYSSLRDHSEVLKFRSVTGSKDLAWHGDIFKVVFFIHDFIPTLSFATVKDNGNRQTIVWRKPRAGFRPIFGNVERISRLTYFDMVNHEHAINLMPEADAIEAPLADLLG